MLRREGVVAGTLCELIGASRPAITLLIGARIRFVPPLVERRSDPHRYRLRWYTIYIYEIHCHRFDRRPAGPTSDRLGGSIEPSALLIVARRLDVSHS